jgi:mono/diheme cytochrome c family protein
MRPNLDRSVVTEPATWFRQVWPARFRLPILLLALLALAGCRSDMYDQPRFEPLEPTTFFADRTSARPLVEGTVPRPTSASRSEPADPLALQSGMVDGKLATVAPFPITRRVLERGQQRYRIFCVPCHAETGDGQGIIVQRGFTPPPALYSEPLRRQPLGHFFEVITHGHGVMYSYAARVPPADRWAIAAYIRALQLSRHSLASELTEADRRGFEEGTRESNLR